MVAALERKERANRIQLAVRTPGIDGCPPIGIDHILDDIARGHARLHDLVMGLSTVTPRRVTLRIRVASRRSRNSEFSQKRVVVHDLMLMDFDAVEIQGDTDGTIMTFFIDNKRLSI